MLKQEPQNAQRVVTGLIDLKLALGSPPDPMKSEVGSMCKSGRRQTVVRFGRGTVEHPPPWSPHFCGKRSACDVVGKLWAYNHRGRVHVILEISSDIWYLNRITLLIHSRSSDPPYSPTEGRGPNRLKPVGGWRLNWRSTWRRMLCLVIEVNGRVLENLFLVVVRGFFCVTFNLLLDFGFCINLGNFDVEEGIELPNRASTSSQDTGKSSHMEHVASDSSPSHRTRNCMRRKSTWGSGWAKLVAAKKKWK